VEPPRFLSVEEVLELHRQGIALYGGELGTRDHGLLESAVLSPQQTFGGEYLYPSLFEMARCVLVRLGDEPRLYGRQ
jgi:death-on-curing protein